MEPWLADVDEPGEPDGAQRVLEPGGDDRQPVEEQDHAEEGEQRRRDQRDRPRVALHPVERGREPADAEADEQEGHSQSERVRDEQGGSPRRLPLRVGHRQHGGEHGPDARRPAEPEGGAGHGCGKRTEPFEVGMEAELLVQARRREQLRAGEVQRHQQHERARHARERLLITEHDVAHRPRRQEQGDEHEREAEHEEPGVDGDPRESSGVGRVELANREAGDEAQVAGHDRQHTWRQEGDDPAAEGDEHVDVRRRYPEHAPHATGGRRRKTQRVAISARPTRPSASPTARCRPIRSCSTTRASTTVVAGYRDATGATSESRPRRIASTMSAFAVTSNRPAPRTGARPERVTRGGWRRTMTVPMRSGTEVQRAINTGHRPEPLALSENRMNTMPKPMPEPAPSASSCNGVTAGAGSCSAPRPTITIAIRASAMPTHASAEGRSPRRRPHTTGSTAPPTALTGATTLMRPTARPR